MHVSLLTGTEQRTRWNSYVMRSAAATCYHLVAWKDIIERSFGHRTYYLYAEHGDKITGIFPIVHVNSKVFGNHFLSLPYFTYGGICADSEETFDALLRKAVSLAGEGSAEHIEMRHTASLFPSLPAKTAKVSMRLTLPDSSDGLWKSFPSKLRSQVQKAVKEGIYSETGREDQLDDFYDVFSHNMRDLGTPVYGKAFFRTILNAFPDSTWIMTVRTREGRAVAAGFLLGFRDMIEIPWASSLRKYNHQSPNMLLYWSALKFAADRGFGTFDFGRSTPGEGTYKFKQQWGAGPVQLYWHYWLNEGVAMPEINPKNPKYQLAIKIWRRLPVGLTRLIGPAIARNLP